MDTSAHSGESAPHARMDLAGRQFGRLTAIEDVGADRKRQRVWLCACACGQSVTVAGVFLVGGKSKSCGCLQRELVTARMTRHGHSRRKTKIYSRWKGMVSRCTNPNSDDFMNYGGRGITVCDRWLGEDGFENFLADVGEPPAGLSLDRIDNDGHYEPGNVRWATASEQNLNQRRRKRS